MKKNIRYVAHEKYMAVVSELGLETVDKAGYVQAKLGNGRCVYVPKTKNVGHIHLQFTPPVGSIVPPQGKFCRIEAFTDASIDKTEEQLISEFKDMLLFAKDLPNWERPKRVQPGAPVASSSPEPQATPEDAEEEKAKRKALIEDTARRLKAKISDKAAV